MIAEWTKRWGPAILIMAIIFLASATPGSDMPKFGTWDMPMKKGGHMLGYALLAAAYLHSLSRSLRTPRMHLIAATCMVLCYAASDEFHQKFVPGRTSSIYDVLVDMIGAMIGLALLSWIRKESGVRSQESASPPAAPD
jgi:VanZ family protein